MDATIRPGTLADVAACMDVMGASIGDLIKRQGRPPVTLDAAFEGRILALGARLAPAGFHVAEQGGRIVGFSSAFPRDGLWFVGFLFVLPEAQHGGLGPALLDRCLAPASADANAFLFASTDLAAIGLYVRRGLLPHATCLTLTLRVPDVDLAPGDLLAGPLTSGSMAFERERFGYARGPDHRALVEAGARGVDLRRADGARAGFFYVTSDARIGPMAVDRAEDWPAALDHALAAARERGLEKVSLRVPHEATHALAWTSARAAQLRSVNLVMSRSPLARLDRALLGPPGLA